MLLNVGNVWKVMLALMLTRAPDVCMSERIAAFCAGL
jgi:hypothetical protein